ncbi:DUF1015 domain-containing protein [Paracnuella aquatica]|uniref:DUF1015 domain-containing protein n=1 Tax=Paracnuella aquatica TaxID=2268757 RepID=UPI000DEF70B7|nr:DUF1015 family protein [Paracnuella aquatica]RPD44214.1 DUF1015 domain-containing protein [Paracnuella aquatica]
MAIIKPFRALRPHIGYEAQVASKPYDVLNSEEARAEAAGNPISFLHVTKSEIDLPAGIDIHTAEVYEKAAENLQRLIERSIIFQEETECYYIYELAWRGRTQTGLVCVSSVQDYFDDVIKKHEFTRPEKEQDRIEHMRTIKAQTGNVFLACKDNVDLTNTLEQWKRDNLAVYNFTADDGVQHTIWVVNGIATIDVITNIFKEQIPYTYIADGHHRAASAAKVSREFPNSEAAQYFLTTIFPADQLAILDYNRVVKDLNGLNEAEFLQKLETDFTVTPGSDPVQPADLHQFGMYLGGRWYTLTAKEGTYTTDPIGVLDVSILQSNVLAKHLAVGDPRTDKRIDFVGGIRGLAELEKRVNSGDVQVAFSLHPVSIQQLFDIADSGNVMPPKSTWFEPKLRDGLLTHPL